MHWYFANRCAGVFPWHQRFQTHYQFSNAAQGPIGEQPGPRPYSKGFGPIGAPRMGLTWNGQREWFVSGVPRSVSDAVVPCKTALAGTDPFPPPTTYTDLLVVMNVDGAIPSEFGGVQNGPLDYDFLSPTPTPGRCYGGHWFFSDSGGMVLEPLVFEDHGFRGPYFAVFVETLEDTHFLSYRYTINNALDGVVDTVEITVGKCFLP